MTKKNSDQYPKEFTEDQMALRYGIAVSFGILIGAAICTLIGMIL